MGPTVICLVTWLSEHRRRRSLSDRATHDPGVFADLALTRECEVFEQLDRCAKEEAILCVTPSSCFGDGLNASATRDGDLGDRSLECEASDSVSAVSLIDEDARNSELRRWRRIVDDLQRRPWGDFDGQVVDQYGLHWLIGFEGTAID